MRVLFLSNWSLHDGLTQSTVIPHLKILLGFSHIDEIIFCTVEREPHSKSTLTEYKHNKIKHYPLITFNIPGAFLRKTIDVFIFSKQIKKLCITENIDLIIARGSPAGALVRTVSQRLNIPFAVESFEPHADYMLESGVWQRKDPKYLLQKYWEKKILQQADFLIPVTEAYKKVLIDKGFNPNNIEVIPCCVDKESFKFNPDLRTKKRKSLGIVSEVVTGIYVGKFGGIYYDSEAVEIFKKASDYFNKRFFLIILTPDDKKTIEKRLLNIGFKASQFLVDYMPHSQVVDYLSCADFAFSPIKPAASRKYCSPVKDGEYWANGLPILIAEGVGDDSLITEQENAGAVFHSLEKYEIENSLKRIEEIISSPNHRERISMLAEKYRGFSKARRVYKKFFTPD